MTFWVAGAVVVGGAIASQGAQSAASTQAGAANTAAQIGQNEFNTITQQEQPYMQSGYGAQGQLNYLLGINPQGIASPSPPAQSPSSWPTSGWGIGPGGNMQQLLNPQGRMTWQQGMPPGGAVGGIGQPNIASPASPTPSPAGGPGSLLQPFTADTFRQYSPAYQFQQQQGMQGVLNSDASGQGALSGATLKDLMSYNQNLANTSFNSAFNQYQTQQGNIFNRLAGIAQLGQTAAANTGQQGTALTGQIGQSITNAGTAAAAGQIGSANAWSGALQSAAPWLYSGGIPNTPVSGLIQTWHGQPLPGG